MPAIEKTWGRFGIRGWVIVAAGIVGCAKAGDGGNGAGANSGGGASNGGSSGNGGTGQIVNLGGFGGLMGPGPGSGEGGTKGCNELTVKFEKQIPTVAVVVDRSTSMQQTYGQAGTRWDVLKSTLLDPASGVIKTSAADVRFGLTTFTSTASGGTCPVVGDVGIALNNYDPINAYYGPLVLPMEKGETPTSETIRMVTGKLMSFSEAGSKFILLATDGEPDTCPGSCTAGDCPVSQRPGYPRDPNCGHDESISAVQEAFAKGIRTFVVGIGDELNQPIAVEHLQSLANAGQGLPVVLGMQENWLTYTCGIPPAKRKGTYAAMAPAMNAKFYRPTDKDTLSADLKGIINSVRSCKFNLMGKVDLTAAGAGSVVLDGVQLRYQDVDGWRMNTEHELEVLGAACGKIQGAGQKIDISFPCEVYDNG